MNNDISFIRKISNPVIITNSDGSIIATNGAADRMLRLMGNEHIENISECLDENKQLHFRNLRIHYESYPLDLNSVNVFLFVFEDAIVFSRLASQVLESIDEGISIIDSEGNLEIANSTASEYIGRSIEELERYMGTNLQQALRENNLLTDALNPIVSREKKIVRKNIRYSNGKVVTYTGTPLFDEGGELGHVVLTGRDVSRLVQLESKLDDLGKIKEEYLSNFKEFSLYKKSKSFICSSAQMELILNLAAKVAATDAPVFITGESGVGKEEIAKYIHNNSDRCQGPFVAINCAAIPEPLIESELFGYEGGSFTGAKRNGKKGLLEEACGGTFFLDEIGELPISMQSKLLRVVQEGNVYRIGSTNPIKIDVRYICATNLTKDQLEDKKKFRRDLYYRLCVVPISVPPLRERPDDIIPLASHFLDMFNQKYGKNVKISNSIMRSLTQTPWLGNVRELKNVIERLVIFSNNDVIEAFDLSMATDIGAQEMDSPIQIRQIMPLAAAYEIVDNILIKKAFEQSSSVVEAANKLQIDPSTIHRKIKAGKLKLN
jgi:PAS domain S-box-containing protein